MKRRLGFTLVELLVVIAVIGVLLSLLLPAISAMRGKARMNHCASNLRNIGMALNSYDDIHHVYPPGTIRDFNSVSPPSHLTQNTSFMVHMLALLDNETLYLKTNFEVWPGVHPANRTVYHFRYNLWVCPSDIRNDEVNLLIDALGPGQNVELSPINYAVCMGIRDSLLAPELFARSVTNQSGLTPQELLIEHKRKGMFYINSNTNPDHVRTMDGLSKTIAVGEFVRHDPLVRDFVNDSAGFDACKQGQMVGTPGVDSNERGRSWYYNDRPMVAYFNTVFGPNDTRGSRLECELSLPSDPLLAQTTGALGARSRHGGIVNVLFGSGTVQAIGDGIDIDIWRNLSTWRGEETETDF